MQPPTPWQRNGDFRCDQTLPPRRLRLPVRLPVRKECDAMTATNAPLPAPLKVVMS